MKIHWSPEAVTDFTTIIQYIRRDNPPAALRVGQSIYKSIARLSKFSNLGRSGRVDGTQELPFPTASFYCGVSCKENVVEIVRLLHGAQRWPQKSE